VFVPFKNKQLFALKDAGPFLCATMGGKNTIGVSLVAPVPILSWTTITFEISI
jgi:hypothetical protein